MSKSATINYSVEILQPQTHYAKISMEITGYSGTELTIAMPVWAPGSYLVREFERNIDNVNIFVNNELISSQKNEKNTWKLKNVKNKKVVFQYAIYAFELSVRTSFINSEQAFLHNSSIFVYCEELKNIGGTIAINYFKDWKKISTSLTLKNKKSNYAELEFTNADDLFDSPIEIGNHGTINYTAAGVPHEIAMIGENNSDSNKLKKDLKKVCETMTNIVGKHPCKKYIFFVQHVETGGGGLEHLNSCTVMMPRFNYIDEGKYRNFLNLCAHEYFHLWNVKRIRPKALGPFNYNEENYTNLLWVAEGITSYYDEMAMYRMEYIDKKDILSVMQNYINELENRPGSRVQSLAESSWDAWIKEYRPNENTKNTTISYYSKGLVVAFLLDLTIIKNSDGKKSLDDVMRFLYNEYYEKKNIGFTDDEFKKACEKIAGVDLTNFFNIQVFSIQTPNYNEIISSLGISIKNREEKAKSLSITTALENGRTLVKWVNREGPMQLAGLNVNDEIIAINNVRINNDCDDVLKKLNYPSTIEITINRMGLLQKITCNNYEYKSIKYSLELPNDSNKWVDKWLQK